MAQQREFHLGALHLRPNNIQLVSSFDPLKGNYIPNHGAQMQIQMNSINHLQKKYLKYCTSAGLT